MTTTDPLTISTEMSTPTPKIHLKVLVITGQVHTYSFEPETTVGRVKELVWSSWPSEWSSEAHQPPSPSYLRLLYSGRILDDDSTLSASNLATSTPTSPTIIHLSIRSFSIRHDDEPKKSSKRAPSIQRQPSRPAAPAASSDEHSGGCKCIIM